MCVHVYQTHSDSTPSTLKATKTVSGGAFLSAQVTSSTGREVAFNPVMSVLSKVTTVGKCGTMLAIVEGSHFAIFVGIVLAYCVVV